MAILKTKVKFDKARLEAELKKRVQDAIQDPALLDEIGKFTVDRIRFEARRQKPLNESRSFPDLKDSSKRIRKNLEKYNDTTRVYQSGRSNVSFTGQLLDGLIHKVIQSRAAIQVFFDGTRFPYKTKDGFQKLDSKSKTNKGVAEDLFSRGFVVFDNKGLQDETFQNRIKNIVRKFLRKNLR